MKGGAIRDHTNHTRHLLGKNLSAARLREGVPLQGKVLVEGENSGVADEHALGVGFPVGLGQRMHSRLARLIIASAASR
jgi:hypothetical protein